MNITFRGAAGGEVTGSAYVVRTRNAKVLVDFGMFQGGKKAEQLNRPPNPGTAGDLDAVILTHAHLDHTGRLPLLVRAGYTGPIHATSATIELTRLILKDAGHLQMADTERQNRKRKRTGQPLLEPLYTQSDVEGLTPLFREFPYGVSKEIAAGISVRAVEAGHMLGSVSLEMTVTENGTRKVVVFSGDLGPRGAPLHKDPTPFQGADAVFLESTYGDREHPDLTRTAVETREVVARAVESGHKILVPAFAIGRTQLLLYILAGAFRRKVLPPFPIYIDSPMAIEATKIYSRHVELYDEEALAMRESGDLAEQLENAHFCSTANDSRALNDVKGPCLIMAGSGMCTGGRILHHLRHNLAQPDTTVLFVGYQGHGSLGRRIVDGEDSVNIFGEKIPVRAGVHTFGGLSGHAGQGDLVRWLESMAAARPRVILTHGEARGRTALGDIIRSRFDLSVECPGLDETIEI